MPNTTTNFTLNKPLVNNATDEDLWGGYLNDNMDTIDTQLKVARDSVSRSISSSDSVVAGDRNKTLLVSASGGAVTITLIAAATAASGFVVTIKKTDSSGNAVTIDGNASETIDGATTKALSGQYNSVILVCDGSNWHIQGQVVSATAVASASTTVEGIAELATTAETQTGTDTARVITPAGMKAALGFSTYYESSQTSITASTAVSLTHALGAIPKLMNVELVCQSTDGGYSAGDRIQINSETSYASTYGVSSSYNTTTINIVFGTNMNVRNKSTGALVAIDFTLWKVVARAWA